MCVCTPAQSCLTLCDLMDSSPLDSIHGIFPGKNAGAGCHFLPQGTLLTQGSNPYLLCLLHWQEDSLPLVPPIAIILLGVVYHLNQYGQLILQDRWTFTMSSPPLWAAKALTISRKSPWQRVYPMCPLWAAKALTISRKSPWQRVYPVCPLWAAKALTISRKSPWQRVYPVCLPASACASLFVKMSCLLRQYLGCWFQGIESVTFFNFLEFPCLWHSRKGILAYLGFS